MEINNELHNLNKINQQSGISVFYYLLSFALLVFAAVITALKFHFHELGIILLALSVLNLCIVYCLSHRAKKRLVFDVLKYCTTLNEKYRGRLIFHIETEVSRLLIVYIV